LSLLLFHYTFYYKLKLSILPRFDLLIQ